MMTFPELIPPNASDEILLSLVERVLPDFKGKTIEFTECKDGITNKSNTRSLSF